MSTGLDLVEKARNMSTGLILVEKRPKVCQPNLVESTGQEAQILAVESIWGRKISKNSPVESAGAKNIKTAG